MIEICFLGFRIQHKSPPPYRVEHFSNGLACILGSDGVNRINFPDRRPTPKLIGSRVADDLARELNKAAGAPYI